MRGLAHLFRRNEELDLRACWLNKDGEDEYALWALYTQGTSICSQDISASGSEVEQQIECSGLLLYDVSSHHVALATSKKIALYDRMTGRMFDEHTFQDARSIALCEEALFVAGDTGLWRWSHGQLIAIHRRPTGLLCSFAGRLAVLEKDNHCSIMGEHFSITCRAPYGHETLDSGLNLALGTEQGTCWIASEERDKVEEHRISSVAITALCWTKNGQLYLGDEEGGFFSSQRECLLCSTI